MTYSDKKKKRNPPWSRQELILALELYRKHGLLDDHSAEVIKLSDMLKELAFVQEENPELFRNANGVAMKLANFAAIDPNYHGRGLTSFGRKDKEIWDEFENNLYGLEVAADELRALRTNVLEEIVENEPPLSLAESHYEDERERVARSIVQRRGQPAFRKQLIEAYRGRCAITGCNALAALEAAHVLAYRGAYSNKISNGLLLRADVHTLFDLGLIAVETANMSCLIAPQLYDTEYSALVGRQIIEPEEQSSKPRRPLLDMHRNASSCLS